MCQVRNAAMELDSVAWRTATGEYECLDKRCLLAQYILGIRV